MALTGLHEFFSTGDANVIEGYASPVLRACQEILEDERTSLTLLRPLLNLLTVLSVKFTGVAAATYLFLLKHASNEVVSQAIHSLREELQILKSLDSCTFCLFLSAILPEGYWPWYVYIYNQPIPTTTIFHILLIYHSLVNKTMPKQNHLWTPFLLPLRELESFIDSLILSLNEYN